MAEHDRPDDPRRRKKPAFRPPSPNPPPDDPETLPPLPDEDELPTMAAPADPITVLPIPEDEEFEELETVRPLPDSIAPGKSGASSMRTRTQPPPPPSPSTGEIDPAEVLSAIAPSPRAPAAATPAARRSRGLLIAAALLVVVAIVAGAWVYFSDGDGGAGPPVDVPSVHVPPPPDDAQTQPAPPVPVTGALVVTSDPGGAVVFVDDVERGPAPATVSDLPRGAHAVRVEAPFHEPWTAERDVVPGQETTVTARLVRGTGTLTLSKGRPGAAVRLVRAGTPPKEYEERLDASGGLPGLVVESGEYELTVALENFATVRQSLTLDRGSHVTREITQAALESRLIVTSVPTGATASLDGSEIGATPLDGVAVSSGHHTLTLTYPEYEDLVREFDVSGNDTLRLEGLRLVSWPRLDLSAITDGDVTVWLDGTALRAGQRVHPGVFQVELRRPDHAAQTVELTAEAGGKALLTAQDWIAFRAELDLSRIGDGVTAAIDGAPARGVLRYPSARTVTVDLERTGFVPQRVKVELSLGATRRPDVGPWVALTGRLDLSALAADVTATLDGHALTDGVELEPGSYVVRLTRPKHVDQDVRVDVAAGGTATVRAGAWERAVLTAAQVRALLTSLARWDAADDGARADAAAAVAAANPGFRLKGIERHRAGGAEHSVAHYVHAGTGLEFALIPAGSFDMGEPVASGDSRRHTVTLTAPYLAGVTEVTQKVWKTVAGGSPSEWRGDDLPVESVSYVEARDFCEKAGLTLPTEAQWEYACRAGVTGTYACGDDPGGVDAFAWHFRNSDQRTHPVAQKSANAFGLFDVHGNVREWCLDVRAPYTAAPQTDPVGPEPPGDRAVRGGGCRSEAENVGSAYRDGATPTATSPTLGLRAFAPVRLP